MDCNNENEMKDDEFKLNTSPGLTLRKKNLKKQGLDSLDNCPKLWLAEELLLLAIKDNSGYCSFFNSSLSSALRGSILIELWLRGRIGLGGAMKTSGRRRPVIVRSAEPTGCQLLDEALYNIGQAHSEYNVTTWLSYMNGETWNPFNLKYQLKCVRERLAKDLVEKGVLRNDKQNFYFFDMPTHPLEDLEAKRRVVEKVQTCLLTGWNHNLERLDPRLLSLTLLGKAAEVVDTALDTLPEDERDVAARRLQDMTNENFSCLGDSNHRELHWPVFYNFFS